MLCVIGDQHGFAGKCRCRDKHIHIPDRNSGCFKLHTQLCICSDGICIPGNNFNQIAKRVNSTGRFYEEDMNSMRELLGNLWAAMSALLAKLASLK